MAKWVYAPFISPNKLITKKIDITFGLFPKLISLSKVRLTFRGTGPLSLFLYFSNSSFLAGLGSGWDVACCINSHAGFFCIRDLRH